MDAIALLLMLLALAAWVMLIVTTPYRPRGRR